MNLTGIKTAITYGVPPDWTSLSERTAFNRYMVINELYIQKYLYIEEVVRNLKRGDKVPDDIPLGYVPGGLQ